MGFPVLYYLQYCALFDYIFQLLKLFQLLKVVSLHTNFSIVETCAYELFHSLLTTKL